MSRAIKFRAWDDVNQYYFYDVAIYPDNVVGIQRHNIESEMLKAEYGATHWTELGENVIIEQYTGLTDKNGKEIYEGDIIQCHLSPISSTIFTGVVEFRPGCIMFRNFADGGAYAFNFLGAIEAVIGNIHENPELLGDTNDTDMGDNEELIKLIEQEEKDGE